MKITPIYKEIDKIIIETTVLEQESSSESYANWNIHNEFWHWLNKIKMEGDMVLALPCEMKARAGTKLRITVEKM